MWGSLCTFESHLTALHYAVYSKYVLVWSLCSCRYHALTPPKLFQCLKIIILVLLAQRIHVFRLMKDLMKSDSSIISCYLVIGSFVMKNILWSKTFFLVKSLLRKWWEFRWSLLERQFYNGHKPSSSIRHSVRLCGNVENMMRAVHPSLSTRLCKN